VTSEPLRSTGNAAGILSVLLAMALFVLNDSMVKLASEHVPVTEVMAVRGLMAVALMGAIVAATVQPARWHQIMQPRVLVRGLLEVLLVITFLIALPHLPLADITAIQQATPLALTALSAVVLKEHVGWRRWVAVAVGFVGVLLVIQPTGQGINVYALSALACALLVAARDIVTRGIDPTIPTPLITFTTTLTVMVAGFAGAPLETWVAPSGYVLALFAGSAVLVTAANFFIIRAYREGEISVIAPFRYSGVLWAVLLGFIIWGHIPNTLAIAGTAILVASGLYIMHREAMRKRSSPVA
jgi:drug/metabolite transporter (DMT)-like permease